MKKLTGFSLISLLIGLAVLSILTTTVIPNLQLFLIKLRVNNEISELNRLLLLARNKAITSGQIVTVCPLSASSNCSTNWQQVVTVFIDVNANKYFDVNTDILIKQKQAISTGDLLVYGKGRNAVKYDSTGKLDGWGSNGTFRYCPKNHQDLSKGIRVAVSGRLYTTSDIDHDGKDEDRNGKELTCSS
jgi:type IV fimbrial biogenesis protein FimT